MKLENLRPAAGSVHKVKRIARGQGSGHGGTATRGHKGDKARSGHKNKRGFEGGQTPLQRRLPKRGFKNINRVEYVAFNLDRLQQLSEKLNVTELSAELLYQIGQIRRDDLVKVLGAGEVKSALTLSVHACSESAKAAIEAAGGKITLVSAPTETAA